MSSDALYGWSIGVTWFWQDIKSAASEDRTPELRIRRPTRSQLRYRRCAS
jgi:hypothetical protein